MKKIVRDEYAKMGVADYGYSEFVQYVCHRHAQVSTVMLAAMGLKKITGQDDDPNMQ